MGDSRERFQEVYEVISTALKGEPFAYHGTQIDMPKKVSVRPRVAGVTTDRIHFYGAIGSPGSASVMAEMGLPPMCTTIGDMDTQAGILRTWDETARAHGFPTDVMKPIMINCIVADTDEEAVELAQRYIPRFMQAQIDHYRPEETDWEELPSYRAWKGQFAGMKAKTDPANIPSWAEYQLVGSPETVAERVQEYVDVGFNHLFLHAATPGVPHDVRRGWTKRFIDEVAPQFTGAGAPASATGATGYLAVGDGAVADRHARRGPRSQGRGAHAPRPPRCSPRRLPPRDPTPTCSRSRRHAATSTPTSPRSVRARMSPRYGSTSCRSTAARSPCASSGRRPRPLPAVVYFHGGAGWSEVSTHIRRSVGR